MFFALECDNSGGSGKKLLHKKIVAIRVFGATPRDAAVFHHKLCNFDNRVLYLSGQAYVIEHFN